MKLFIQRIFKRIAVPVFECMSAIMKRLCSLAYRGLFLAEWFVDNPENFDHEIDLYWQWNANCLPHWVERGVYSVQALKMFEHPIVIELCCGDGFNSKHFYSTSADKIFACDFDQAIIRTAKRKNKRDNITYKVADIRQGINQIFGKEVAGGA